LDGTFIPNQNAGYLPNFCPQKGCICEFADSPAFGALPVVKLPKLGPNLGFNPRPVKPNLAVNPLSQPP